MAARAARNSRARPTRRRQEDRSAETRQKVIRAARECVAEFGFRGATMTAIAERAGVTWGGIQHQFREKDAILDAVVRDSLAELEGQLAALSEVGADPRTRVRAFVRKAGELARGPAYRAFVEIQLNRARGSAGRGAGQPDWEEEVAESLARGWSRAFGGLGIPPGPLRAARRFAFMVISGIAAEAMLFPTVDFSKQHLSEREATLLRIYSSE
jgi:AcrR family transcriptional regulator